MGDHNDLRVNGGMLSKSKQIRQEEKLTGVSRLLSGPLAHDPATIAWAALLLRKIAGASLETQEIQMYVLEGL